MYCKDRKMIEAKKFSDNFEKNNQQWLLITFLEFSNQLIFNFLD